MIEKVYLGDSVYGELDRGMIKLTTDNGLGPTNTIYLELSVYENLLLWVDRVAAKHGSDKMWVDHIERKWGHPDVIRGYVQRGPQEDQGEASAPQSEEVEEGCLPTDALVAPGDEGDEEEGREEPAGVEVRPAPVEEERLLRGYGAPMQPNKVRVRDGAGNDAHVWLYPSVRPPSSSEYQQEDVQPADGPPRGEEPSS